MAAFRVESFDAVTTLRNIKPGWYLLLALFLYSVIITVVYSRAQRNYAILSAAQAQTSLETAVTLDVRSPQGPGLWFPIPGAQLPEDPSYLPGAARLYRRGENQGFDFYGNDAGIPIAYGQPVIAAADGNVKRADILFEELDTAEWQALLSKVADQGATEEELNLLRGRQIWIELNDGRTLRYAHLSAIHPLVELNEFVYRGQVIGYVGNSGTDDGIAGTQRGARLHFEVWQNDGSFFGQNLGPEAAVRSAAESLFNGP